MQAGAAETADLAVRGMIRPSACNITLSNNGQVDFGTISAQTLHATRTTQLPDAVLNMQISCDAATAVAVSLTDNRADSKMPVSGVGATWTFGLGKTGETNIGAYSMTLDSVTADGTTARPLASANQGSTWSAMSGTYTLSAISRIYAWSTAGGSSTTPSALTNVDQQIRVHTWVNNTTAMPVDGPIALDGSTTISVVYL